MQVGKFVLQKMMVWWQVAVKAYLKFRQSVMNLKTQLSGLNEFLTEVYGAETRLSTILANMGFSSQQIGKIRDLHIEQIINLYISFVQERLLSGRDGERLFRIINHYFGLDGEPTETLTALGKQLKISGERVRQLKQKALRKSKNKTYLRRCEENLRDAALTMINGDKIQ